MRWLHTGEKTAAGDSQLLLGVREIIKFTSRVRLACCILIFSEDTDTPGIAYIILYCSITLKTNPRTSIIIKINEFRHDSKFVRKKLEFSLSNDNR